MDMYIEAPDDLGGYVRMYEVAELIRRGAPIYLKFGLSKAPAIYPYGHHLRDVTLNSARERVRRGRLARFLRLRRHQRPRRQGHDRPRLDLLRHRRSGLRR